MALYEDVDAIYDDGGLSFEEKYRQAGILKCYGIRDAVLASWTLPRLINFSQDGAAFSITVTNVSVVIVTRDGLDYARLVIDGTGTKNGQPLRYPNGSWMFPVIIDNPPCLCKGNGVNRAGRSYSSNLVDLAQEILQQVAGGV